MEQLVHNLEHGYTILWYDDTITGADRSDAQGHRHQRPRATTRRATGKFIVVRRGTTTTAGSRAASTSALSHWGAEQGHRQLCGKVSGEAVQEFIDDHSRPATRPEPNAA